jgi:NADH:ubiquinone reductase (H+-translocating)
MAATSGSCRVVIVGGGFAGPFATRALRRAPVQVTLIDRAEHHLFRPLLYQCATGIPSEGKIAASAARTWQRRQVGRAMRAVDPKLLVCRA